MPDGFGYPVNHDAWTALQLRASYGALEGEAISVIGRLAPGVTRSQADAELLVLGKRTAAALPATHEHLRSRVILLGEISDFPETAEIALRNLPVLLVLIVACMNVGTLVYARTATREGELAMRSALGASRARIMTQLFVEAFILASVAAVAGLITADRVLRWGIEGAYAASGAPFWMTGGLRLTTIVYAAGLALVTAAMLSLLPALRATRARVQPHLANLGTGSATLRFGRVWTSAMIAQIAVTAMAIPGAMETANQTMLKWRIRAEFPSREYLAAHLDFGGPSFGEPAQAFEARRTRTFAELERRITQEPGVIAVTFADRAPGTRASSFGARTADVETSRGGGRTFVYQFTTSSVGPGFFDVFDRPIVAGRAFQGSDWSSDARTVIVNEAFVRGFRLRGGSGLPLGARLRYLDRSRALATESWYEIVGIVRDFRTDPGDEGDEQPYVFQPASVGTVDPLVISVRMGGDPAALARRLPAIASSVDAGLYVEEAHRLDEWMWKRDMQLIRETGAVAGLSGLVLLLSAMGIFSLLSVSVSRRTREIGLRAALGASARHLLAEVVFRAMILMGTGLAAGGAVVMLLVALWRENIALFAGHLALTAAVMMTVAILACIAPARRALRINPIDALRQT
jgi:predicted permease